MQARCLPISLGLVPMIAEQASMCLDGGQPAALFAKSVISCMMFACDPLVAAKIHTPIHRDGLLRDLDGSMALVLSCRSKIGLRMFEDRCFDSGRPCVEKVFVVLCLQCCLQGVAMLVELCIHEFV